MRIESFTLEELRSHGIDKAFSEILSNPKEYHPDLDITIGKVNWDYYIPEGVEEVIPVWDTNADAYVRWKREGKMEYVFLSHDDPEWKLAATSEQGIMSVLWNQWCEFQEEDEELERFAQAIGFKYWKKAFELWERDYDEFKAWQKQLN